jgi:UDP-N-acetylglucosamine--dolichyl-phosphate N-acetylglucosaminephosphotransferase
MGHPAGNMLVGFAVVLAVSFASAHWIAPAIIRKLKAAGITGRDVHKRGRPEIPEMGGIIIVVGFAAGILGAVGLYTFFGLGINLTNVLIGLITVLMMALIGIFDDLFEVGQKTKAVLPLFAALPLMAIHAGDTVMTFPFVGPVDVGMAYVVILVPLGVSVASNLTNMLAGFNGVETGLGAIMTGSVAFIALTQLGTYPGAPDALVISTAMCGALIAFTKINWFPAKVFPGDVGTLIIGASLASAVIVGNMEAAGAMLVVPHVVDFLMKARHGFPKTFGKVGRGGKLFCPQGGPMGLGQYIMAKTGGLGEKRLVAILLVLELLFALVAIKLFAVL